MFVLCPHCQFLVAVDPATGLPPEHCPRCDAALITRADAPAAESDAVAAESDTAQEAVADAARPEVAAAGEDEASIAPDDVVVEASTENDAPPAAPPETPPAPPAPPSPKAAPSFASTARIAAQDAPSARHWPQAAAIAGLSLLLAVQILVADRAQLAADAGWRPAMIAICTLLRCDLPSWHEPSAITLLDRDVAGDASRPGVLHVTARFRNDARWSQPWPKLVLTLSDVDGRVAGARVFEPRDYLGDSVTKNGMATGQMANVAMDVVEPASRIVAFTFDFR